MAKVFRIALTGAPCSGKTSAIERLAADFYNEKTVYDGEEIQTALKGSYGAVTRFSSGDQPGVTLYSAIPVINNESNIK